MANGTVIRYEGKRGVVWRIQYRDASGKQVKETVGAERDGATEKQAREHLADRLSDVRRKAYRRPRPLTFKAYTKRWFEEGKLRRAWKPNTLLAYENVLGHLNTYFGPLRLASIRPGDVAGYTRAALSGEVLRWPDGSPRPAAPKSVQLHVNLLHDVFKTARAEELVESNPVDGAERPKIKRRRWRILEPVEVARVQKAFTDEQARTIFLTLILTGIRRFELQALRWRDVDLVESVLRIRESKSEEGERAIALSPRACRGALAASPPLRIRGRGRAGLLPPEAGLQDRPRVVWGRVSLNAEAGRDHGLHSPLPRRPPCLADQRCRRGRAADRADEPRRPPLDADDEDLPAPGWDGLPRRGGGARAAPARYRRAQTE
jgi:integrase